MNAIRLLKSISVIPLTLLVSIVFAIVPSDLRESDPIAQAFYHKESFRGEQAIVPNTPQEVREKLTSLIQTQPENISLLKALSDIEVELLDFAQAEIHIKQFVEKSTDKDSAYYALENFYHKRLRFHDEYKEILNHANVQPADPMDPENNRGPYTHYHRALAHRAKYKLPEDPQAIYKIITEKYPQSLKALQDWIDWRIANDSNAKRLNW